MTISLLLALPSYAWAAGDRVELAQKYPDIEEGSTKAENPKILCPFHRMLERAGVYDGEKQPESGLLVSILKISRATHEFGCKFVACGAVATAVSGGQLTEKSTKLAMVNLEALHTARGVAHECGLTFAKGGTTVSDEVRASTLAALHARADGQGRLSFSDLKEVKLNICKEQGVSNDLAGETEIGLIYTFLGGNERGFIDYDDVERFLHSELPKTIGEPSVPNLQARIQK